MPDWWKIRAIAVREQWMVSCSSQSKDVVCTTALTISPGYAIEVKETSMSQKLMKKCTERQLNMVSARAVTT